MIKSNINNKKKYGFEILFAISFILNGYATGISGISLGSALLAIIIAYAFLYRKSNRENKIGVIYIFYFVWFSASLIGVCNAKYVSMNSMIVGNLKILLWLLMVTLVVYKFFDFYKFTKCFVIFSIFLTIYIIIQTVCFYILDIYLPNIFTIGPLQPYAEDYADYERFSNSDMLRPASLLSESSFFGNFVLCSLAMYLELNYKQMDKKKFAVVLFLTIGIIVSTSTAAIVCLILLWMIYLYRLKVNKIVLIILGMFLALFLYFTSGLLLVETDNGFLNALQYAFEKFEYLDTSSRFGKSYNYLNLLSSTEKMFGVGIGNEMYYLKQMVGESAKIYFNSATSLILQIGYVGFFSFIIFIIYLYVCAIRKKDVLVIFLLTVYFIKGFASGIYFSTYGILFVFIIMGRIYVKE